MKYRIYETCVAEFSAVIEANSQEEAQAQFDKTNPHLTLESIVQRLEGSELSIKRIKDKSRKQILKKKEKLVEEK